MSLEHWIPGLGHWRLGKRSQAVLVLALFLSFLALAVGRAATLSSSITYTFHKVVGAKVPYTWRDLDLFFSTLFLGIALVNLVLYCASSCNSLARGIDKPRKESQGQWAIIWHQFKKNRLAVVGALLILVLYLVAILAPLLAPFDPTEQGNRVKERLLQPSLEHPLGTDRFARDVFSRILYGSRISLMVGFMAVGISVTIGTVMGAVAGYYGRWVDNLLMRFVDMMLSFPTIVLIITIISIWRNQSIWIIICIIGVTSWMGVARLVRGEFLLLKELDFFQAARALGAGPLRLIFRHLLPNALTPIIVSSTLQVGTIILVEASLSYLGLGVQPPTPSWGNIVYDTKGNLFTEWWLPLSAGLAIVVTVVAYNLVGDGLRDALDPRLRE